MKIACFALVATLIPRLALGQTVGVVRINGASSDEIDLDEGEGAGYTFLPAPIPAGATVTCEVACTSSGSLTVALGYADASADDEIVTEMGECPVSAAFTFDEERAGSLFITAVLLTGEATGVSASCTSPDVWCICFSGESTVQVQGKGVIAMKDLQVNDQVFVGHDASGTPEYQPVYAFGHYDQKTPTAYLQIHTAADKKPIEISSAHLLYKAGEDYPVRADSIQVGDFLVTGFAEANSAPARVTKINKVNRDGSYMPLTKNGPIVVNNLLASSYVSVMDDAPHFVKNVLKLISEDQLLHAWLAPYRVVCSGLPSLCTNDKNEDGIAYWLVFGRWLASLANGWGLISQFLGLSMAGLVVGFFLVLEALTLPGMMVALVLVGATKKILSSKGPAKKVV